MKRGDSRKQRGSLCSVDRAGAVGTVSEAPCKPVGFIIPNLTPTTFFLTKEQPVMTEKKHHTPGFRTRLMLQKTNHEVRPYNVRPRDDGKPHKAMKDRKSTRLNSSHLRRSRMPSSA